MNRPLLALGVLILAILACDIRRAADLPTADPAPKTLPTPALGNKPAPPNALGELVLTGNVYVRSAPNGIAIGSLALGEAVGGECVGNWCKITGGYIWRGCTDNNPNALGCKKKLNNIKE